MTDSRTHPEYDFAAEARRVCDAIGSDVGWMTIQCALREAYASALSERMSPNLPSDTLIIRSTRPRVEAALTAMEPIATSTNHQARLFMIDMQLTLRPPDDPSFGRP